ncbi:MAG: cytochrome c biogenesis protein CcsA [Verrucomicrobiota bacterium]
MKARIPLILTALFAVWLLASMRLPGPKNGFDLTGFGQLPVLLNGRVQPLDSVARNSLLQIRAKQSVAWSDPGASKLKPPQTMSATEWLVEVLASPTMADTRPIFRIDSAEMQGMLNLSDERKHFSYQELKEKLEEIEKQARRVNDIDSTKRTPFEHQIMRLYNALMIYTRLKVSVKPEDSKDFAADLEQFKKAIGPGLAAAQAQEAKQTFDQKAVDALMKYVQPYHRMQEAAYPLIVPPLDPAKNRDGWANAGASLMETAQGGTVHPAMGFYAGLMSAYAKNDPAGFNRALADYNQWLTPNYQLELTKSHREFFFNHLQAFYKATVIYVVAFIFAIIALFNLTEWLRRSAFNLVALAWVMHTVGLGFRVFLEGRPPVTNLYSSAVFIGWGAVFLGLVLERFFPLCLGVVVAAAVGFVTQIIAHNLALGGDTMEMMRAVLDSNFWLATHVITVTLGYSATFFAGVLAVFYVLLGFFTRNLTPDRAGALSRMVYGVTCFAALFSFVGTVLGGIWADQSWGRFWGWDPKENGALMIVLWNAVYLHARWCGMWQERGLMNVAIFGNVVTAWSWFGVNMLGVGLHSYGFMDSAFKWLVLFVSSQAAIMVLAMLPEERWKSRTAEPAPVPVTDPEKL